MVFDIIVSFEKKTFACGIDNRLPWHSPIDLKLFKKITTEPLDVPSILIVGYNTFRSLPRTLKPCNRRFIVIVDTSRDFSIPIEFKSYVIGIVKSFRDAYRSARVEGDSCNVFVIGGANVYAQALKHSACRYIYAGIFDLNKVVYDRVFPLVNLERLDKVETIHEKQNIELQDGCCGTYEMIKFILK